ncbi:pantoate--beta-alanine ligase [Peptostreptococcus sp. MV1]|uniref:pantoate--beta-alanine ligase n=1 Tax=Peptostreptococcus sp. MV1 TaxID=1219626 RepID=UPI00050E641F|nr:pantoate--beta-alanine ligase [Peptostreptococcus sp. MV1]KGF13102.1 pantoate--beta-alanine ligase [Peptostreptococcus sp. MV1]
MKVIRRIEEIVEITRKIKADGYSLGMVPTMGCLHEGHKSLIKKAVDNNDKVVVSVFVNPTQFGPDEDYESYPRTLEADAKLCEEIGADYIFHPEPEEMYPEGYSTFVVPSEKMTNILCGITRPGHFRGVCTVLTKLFNIIRPDRAYFGEKDIQQLAIVKRMVTDFNFGIDIIACPIVREDDGLAKSSRNTYLNAEERQAATVLRRSILEGKKLIDSGVLIKEDVLKTIKSVIESEKLARIDYVEIIDFDTFDQVDLIKDNTLIAMAVYIGKTRLIDNMIINL